MKEDPDRIVLSDLGKEKVINLATTAVRGYFVSLLAQIKERPPRTLKEFSAVLKTVWPDNDDHRVKPRFYLRDLSPDLPLLTCIFEQNTSEYDSNSQTMRVGIGPILRAQNHDDLVRAFHRVMETICHEIEHIYFPGVYFPGADEPEGVAETINYLSDPGEVRAFAKQFAYRYLVYFPGQPFFTENMRTILFDDSRAINYFVQFADPAKQAQYLKYGDLGTIHSQIVALTSRFVDDPESSDKITRYLKDSLPETEERINTPMDPNCKVSVVIPSYGEWDYIFRPLQSLSRQEGVNPDQYEVIIVVNNPANPPVPVEGETSTFQAKRLAQYDRAIQENQKTINLIRYINGESVDLDLTEVERGKADRIKRSGLKLFCVDKASSEKTLVGDEANVGGARNRGVAEAIERFFSLRRNGVVAQSDADTRFDSHYIHGLIEVFEERPELVGLAGVVKLDDSGDKMLKLSSLYLKLHARYKFMLRLLLEDRGVYQVEDEVSEKAPKRVDGEVELCGANMASRAFETAIVGGVPKISNQEDTGFGRRLSTIGEIARDDRVKAMPADRLSVRTGKHGHGYGKSRVADSLAERGSIYVPDPEQLANGVTEGVQEIPLEEAASKVISLLREGKQLQYESCRSELVDYENQVYEDRMRVVEMLLDIAFDGSKKGFDTDLLAQTVNSQKGNLNVDIESGEFLDDLGNGAAAADKFVEIVLTSDTREDALRELRDVFMEELTPLDENPALLASFELKALSDAIRKSYKL